MEVEVEVGLDWETKSGWLLRSGIGHGCAVILGA
jgi:hypothetical protein